MHKNLFSLANTQSVVKSNYSGTAELYAIEQNLKKYNKDVVLKISKYFQPSDIVLEFGAGIGTLASILHSIKKIKPDCLEIDKLLREVLISRGFNCYDTFDAIPKCYDAVYTSNVLEHIEDDVDALRKLHAVLKEDGLIAIYVPAFMCLYSEFDASVGHYRRYGKRELKDKLANANFKVIEHYYIDSIGFFAWLFLKLRGYDAKKSAEASQNHSSFEIYGKYIYTQSAVF